MIRGNMKGMFRVRRRFALFICAIILVVFLVFYILIDNSDEKKVRVHCLIINHCKTVIYYITHVYLIILSQLKIEYRTIENKLHELELGLNKHRYEVGEMRKQIDTIENSERHTWRLERNEVGEMRQQIDTVEKNERHAWRLERSKAEAAVGQNSQLSADKNSKCNFRTDIIPTPDVQVNDI